MKKIVLFVVLILLSINTVTAQSTSGLKPFCPDVGSLTESCVCNHFDCDISYVSVVGGVKTITECWDYARVDDFSCPRIKSNVGSVAVSCNEGFIQEDESCMDVNENQIQVKQTFSVEANVAKPENIEEAYIIYLVDCQGANLEKIRVSLNNKLISSKMPDCGSLEKTFIEPTDVVAGENELLFSSYNDGYSIDQIFIKIKLKNTQTSADSGEMEFEYNISSFTLAVSEKCSISDYYGDWVTFSETEVLEWQNKEFTTFSDPPACEVSITSESRTLCKSGFFISGTQDDTKVSKASGIKKCVEPTSQAETVVNTTSEKTSDTVTEKTSNTEQPKFKAVYGIIIMLVIISILAVLFIKQRKKEHVSGEICTKCNARIEKGDKYCQECGEKA